ncbi:MAG TPA: FkbM family methyltransferase [Rudaea sp.]
MSADLDLMRLRPPGAVPFSLVLDRRDRRIAAVLRERAVWELPETLLCLRTLRPGMHVVDAGAHVGYYSVLFSQRVGPSGSVRAFEPEPDNFRLLLANLLLNDCRNVQTHAFALAERRGDATLHLSPDNLGDHRLAATPGRAQVEVATIDLDAVLAGSAVDFVKIDTQGAEPRVLAGMAATIADNRERLAVLMEFAPGLLAQAGTAVAAFAAQLDALDARVYAIEMRDRNLSLRRLAPLDVQLAALAQEMARSGEIDASRDLFVVFGAAAERDWLARFRG